MGTKYYIVFGGPKVGTSVERSTTKSKRARVQLLPGVLVQSSGYRQEFDFHFGRSYFLNVIKGKKEQVSR